MKVASVFEIVIVEVKVVDEAKFGQGCWTELFKGE